MLRYIGDNMLNIYPLKSNKLFKTVVHIFSAIVCADNFDALSRLFLRANLEILESIKRSFFCQRKYTCVYLENSSIKTRK
jgi:hypothetical protein